MFRKPKTWIKWSRNSKFLEQYTLVSLFHIYDMFLIIRLSIHVRKCFYLYQIFFWETFHGITYNSRIMKIMVHVICSRYECICWLGSEFAVYMWIVFGGIFGFRISYIFYFAENNFSKNPKRAVEIEKKWFNCIDCEWISFDKTFVCLIYFRFIYYNLSIYLLHIRNKTIKTSKFVVLSIPVMKNMRVLYSIEKLSFLSNFQDIQDSRNY